MTAPPLIISREEARAAGLKAFFIGDPCRRGHIAERSVSEGKCLECCRERDRARYAADPEKRREAGKRLRREEPERMRAHGRASYAKHAEARRDYARERRGSDREAYNAAERERRNANLEKYRTNERNRRITKIELFLERSRLRWQQRGSEYNQQKRRRYSDDPTLILERNAAWRQANYETWRDSVRVAQHRRRAAEGTFTRADIRAILKAQKCRCAYCKINISKQFHIDHIKPISKGGSNFPCNLQLTCPGCNMRKHDKAPEDFARELGLLL